jgi:site-specific recombinase XerC
MSDLAPSLAPKTVQAASALRVLRRCWFLDGVTDAGLSVSVPKVVHRSSGLPKWLPAEQIRALLHSSIRAPLMGCDRAIVTILARSGPRSSDVAGAPRSLARELLVLIYGVWGRVPERQFTAQAGPYSFRWE